MKDFLEELNENLNKVFQEKLKENKHIITVAELFTGVKKYMDIGEYFERFCDGRIGWQYCCKVDNIPVDFSLWEEVKPNGIS